MARTTRNVTGIDGLSGKVGSLVFRPSQRPDETIVSAMPIKGNQGRQPGNEIPQLRIGIIGSYTRRNKFNFRQFFKSNQPYLKGSALFSKLNATAVGPFADPETPDYELFKVSDGLFTDVSFTVANATTTATTLEFELENVIVPAGIVAKLYAGVILPDTFSIIYLEGATLVNGASQTVTITTTESYSGKDVGVFCVETLTLMPSPTVRTFEVS